MTIFKRKSIPQAVALITGFGISGLSAVAIAQQTTPPQKVEKIEVTGSNIKRVDSETSAPIQVITREDIERSAKSTVADLLRDLPSNSGNSFNDTFTNSFSPGATGISLRGLGQKATLVLINGRRMANYGFAQNLQDTYVDLNSIPNSAVERIEILKDGASAVYGSDAIGGVVNIILRKDFQGGEVTINGGTSTEKGLDEMKASLAFGYGDLAKNRFNVFGAFDYYHRDLLTYSERAFTRDQNYRNQVGGNFAWSSGAGTWRRTGPTRREPLSVCPGPSVVTPGSAFNSAPFNGSACAYNPAPYLTLFPESERAGFLGRANFDISSNLSAFAEVMFSKNETNQKFTPAFVPSVAFNPVTGSVDTVSNNLPATHPNNPFGATTRLDYTFFDVGGRDAKIESESYRLLAGLKGVVGKWDWEVGLGKAENEVDQSNPNRVNRFTFATVRDNGSYNFLAPQAAITDQLRIAPKRKATSELDFFDAKVATELMQLSAGPVGFAAGIEHRRESIVDSPDSLLLTGAVLGQGSTATNGDRKNTAAFFEFSIPLAKTLELSLAGRQDKYSDFGSAFSPKAGLKFTPTKEILLRGSASRGFRAPTLPEISPSNATFFTAIVDPDNGLVYNVAGLFQGNPGLKAERSNNYTVGMVIEPWQDFSMSIDMYKIKQKNVVNANSFQYIVDNPDLFPGQIFRDSTTGLVTYITERYRNLSFVDTSGFDIEAKKVFRMGDAGRLTLALNYAFIRNWRTQVAADAPIEDYVDQNGFSDFPRYRGNTSVTWQKNNWTVTTTMNYVHSYENVFRNAAQQERVGAHQTYDLYAAWTGIKNLKISGSVRNITDKDPPFDPSYALGTSFVLYDLRGRYVNLGATYSFK
jgi:iron complex outermembrane recepter protein